MSQHMRALGSARRLGRGVTIGIRARIVLLGREVLTVDAASGTGNLYRQRRRAI